MAQSGHASHLWLTSKLNLDTLAPAVVFLTEEEAEWIRTDYRKIVLKVDSEEQLQLLYNFADSAGIPVKKVIDNGLTEFGGVKTFTCIAIGPAKDVDVDMVTGENGPLGRLKLLT
jgi:peptidyl-tRNA hydrolase